MSLGSRLRVTAAAAALAAVAIPASALAARAPHPMISSFTPGTAAVMTKIVVHGKDFMHVKLVKVDGLKAKYRVDSKTKLTVTIPAKAKSGKIVVTTSRGTAKSAHALKIKA
jgi:phage gp46-like protein